MVIPLIVGLTMTQASLQQDKPAAPVQVMVLGTWHFGNPGADMVNLKSEDVLTSRRQADLERLAAALAAFKPTKIMVERVATTPDLLDPRYLEFKPTDLLRNRDERAQIAYRLAARVGVKGVYAVDEQPAKGEPDYFPIGKVVEYTQAHGKSDHLQHMMQTAEQHVKEFESKQATESLPHLLAEMNDPKGFHGRINDYYEFLKFGNSEDQPGADLNAMWYLRNAKIFGKVATVASGGDRILILFGAGHSYWLRHFASNTPGFKNVDPRPYLRRAG